MIRAALLVSLAALVGCGDGAPTTSAAAPPAITRTGGQCPDADPNRDGPFVDAIRSRNSGVIDAALARNPGDLRAIAAKAIVTGQGTPDPDQAACFAPYF